MRSMEEEMSRIIRRFPPGDYEVRTQDDRKVRKYKTIWRGTLERWVGGTVPKALFRRSGGVIETFTWRSLYVGDVRVTRIGR